MSLLMDALKKAEAEKNRAAKKLERSKPDEVATVSDPAAIAPVTEPPPPTTEKSQDNDPINKVALSLEPITSEYQVAEQAVQHEAVTMFNDVGPDLAESADEVLFGEEDLPVIEAKKVAKPSSHSTMREHPNLHDDNDEQSHLKTKPFDDNNDHQFVASPTSASNVFSVSHKKTGRAVWMNWIFIVLLIVFTIVLLVFYYLNSIQINKLPTTQNKVGNTLSRDVNSLSKEPIIERQTTATTEVIETETTQSTLEPALSEILTITKTIELEPALDEISVVTAENIVETPTPKVVDPEPITTIKELAKTDNESFEQEARTEKSSPSSDEAIAPVSSLIADPLLTSIKNNKQERVARNALLDKAFNAYQTGQFKIAKVFYQDILKSDPNHRDSHLGLAAIAMIHNDQPLAYQHYSRLLELDPDDVLALHGLISLSSDTSASLIDNESAIKILLNKVSDAPYLYFSLGNLYAKQKRWASAKQAFFNAYQRESSNPDYAINLAISFDQLGQYTVALDYYKTALSLVENRQNLRFDVDAIKKRISALDKISILKS